MSDPRNDVIVTKYRCPRPGCGKIVEADKLNEKLDGDGSLKLFLRAHKSQGRTCSGSQQPAVAVRVRQRH